MVSGIFAIIMLTNHSQNTISREEPDIELETGKQNEEIQQVIEEMDDNDAEITHDDKTKTDIAKKEGGTKNNNNAATPPTEKKAEESSANNEPTKPSTSSKQETNTAKQPTNVGADYNLNDRYVIDNFGFPMYEDDGTYSNTIEVKYFIGIEKFDGSSCCGLPDAIPKAEQYAKAHGYVTGDGVGCIPVTWGDVVSQGKALDESKCAQYGLDCGRW